MARGAREKPRSATPSSLRISKYHDFGGDLAVPALADGVATNRRPLGVRHARRRALLAGSFVTHRAGDVHGLVRVPTVPRRR